MMTVALLGAALALGTFSAFVALFRQARGGWEMIAAALLFGLAGFSYFAPANQAGAPKPAQPAEAGTGEALVKARLQLAGGKPMASDRWVVTADALTRNGAFADAAAYALGAVEHDPNNADAWLAIANNLVAHAQGNLTPAALYAYRHALKADPKGAGAPFFLGLALAQRGDLDEARALWSGALKAAPADAPWRAAMQDRLAELDQLIARQKSAPNTSR